MITTENDIKVLYREDFSQLQTELNQLASQYHPDIINLDKLYSVFLVLSRQEEEAMDVVRKSIATDQLELLDVERNAVFREFVDRVKSPSNQFNEIVHLSALRLEVLLDQYVDITRRSYDHKTTAFYKLIKETSDTYLTDVHMIGLAPWTLKLDHKNREFDALMKIRYDEVATRTGLQIEQVRMDIDAVYQNMSDQMNAQIKVNVAIKYEAFVKYLNQRE